MERQNIGLYIHVPFCRSKCPYCDFFSVPFTEHEADRYVKHMISEITTRKDVKADTLYFGGGTPGILGTKRIISMVEAVERDILTQNSEITVEINPESADGLDFKALRSAGVNRLSIGLQSAVDSELKLLGRLHDSQKAADTVLKAQKAGFDNISLDLMLATSTQTKESLVKSIDFCSALNVSHISAYILKIEDGTPYSRNKDKLVFPDEDAQADMYLFALDRLQENGYKQYEISNFSVDGKESRHNLKYWNCDEYLGLGPSAHSFLGGKRFYYERSIEDFYNGKIIQDGIGGTTEEYAMLRLRLCEGLKNSDYKARFGEDIPQKYFEKAKKIKGLVKCDKDSISLTVQGFLLSNAVIAQIIY